MPLPRPPSERANVRAYSGASQDYSYIHGSHVNTCTGDSCYAEVGFNTIMYYVLEQQASEKTNALSLRGKQEPGQYYQYRAIWRYVRFYDAYVKSATRTLLS
jgi:hypothetical protein